MKKFHLAVFLFVGLVLMSCGKVVQEVNEDEPEVAFRFTYSVDVVSSNVLSANEMHVMDPMFATVSGYTDKGLRKELSWGRGVAFEEREEPKIPTHDVIFRVASQSFDKRGVEVKKSDHKWTKLSLKDNDGEYTWDADSTDLRRGYEHYLVAMYTTDSRYRLKWVGADVVSMNAKVALDDITLYDTFISVLKMMRLQDGDVTLGYEDTFLMLFNTALFESLSYQIPSNTLEDFSTKKPIFRFSRESEKTMLMVWDLVQIDYIEAMQFVDTIEDEVLSEKTREVLKTNIAAIRDSETQSDAELVDSTPSPSASSE